MSGIEMTELLEEQRTELLVMIDEFIHDIAKKNLVETSVVIDRLLDIRNFADESTVLN